MEEDQKEKKLEVIGHSLASKSIKDLEDYIIDLEKEIERVKINIEEKNSTLSDANSYFIKR
tara:strand:+ start:1421 stop:1603 length:183 start_codon:yes stop_codon:yes gene_type:complete